MKRRIARFTVVDIETDVPDPKQVVDLCEPFLMGMKSFSIAKGELIVGPYRYFERKHFAKGARELRKYPGPILGYNLLGFDYVVLRELVNVESLFERTVDLLEFLSRKKGSRRGLKLHNVCMELLGKGKLSEDTRGLAAMWMAGDRERVLRYNERDCDLTARLWLQFRNASHVKIQKRTLQFTADDRAFLEGQRPLISHTEWLSEYFERQVSKERVDSFQGLHVNPLDLALEYDRYVCKTSGTVMFTRWIPASDIPSGEDIEPRNCPACGEYVGHSGYVFKPNPTADGEPVEIARLEKLWAMIRRYIVNVDVDHFIFIVDPKLIREPHFEPHFIVEGIPRRERQEVPCYDRLGIDEEDFTLWLLQVKSEARLAEYIRRFREKISYITRRGAKALAMQAMLEGF